MKKIFTGLAITFFSLKCFGQIVSLDPTVSPSLFKYNDQITVTYDVTGTTLASLTNAWIWVWIPGTNTNAKYNVNPANSDPTKTNNAKFTKVTENGKTLFRITFTPSTFFDGDISTRTSMGLLLKGNDWSNGQTTDHLATFWDGSFQVKLNSPLEEPLFVNNGEVISITAETPVNADFDLYVNNVLINEQNGVKNYSYNHSVSETSGSSSVKIVATQGANVSEEEFQYIISANSPLASRPAGVIPGINYNSSSQVTLCLWAPGKSSVYVVGDFNDWNVKSEFLMKKDGEYFWLQVNGLTAGTQYGFQYLIDESIYVADPYADMILDPDDQYIPESVYPDLKSFPTGALKSEWYFNKVSVLQTGQPEFEFIEFTKPAKEKLVIYELLIRDFFGEDERSYQNLIDTISYFKRLGINAIELMPVMEFGGNEGWGYNPIFMFAPDKYYGPKEKLKEFVNVAHANGIAVILDIALNHQDIPNSFLMQDFDFSTFKPKGSNRWFNINATHPFSVFFDMNHESAYTKKYIDTVNYHWLNEYNVDGFRFDLSKGFTQTNNPDNVGAWGVYDPSRIAILKRMADKIWAHTPDAYIILEHFADNNEEKELAEYRANEGKGMMLWGNLGYQYGQNTMGFDSDGGIASGYYGSRNWTVPHLVTYMESHDEERLMIKNLEFGNSAGEYSVRDTATALIRQRAAATVFYTIPGPKMLWQFGELGYDYSINHCEDGTVSNDCRLSPKPVKWNYQTDGRRTFLYEHISELIDLRKTYDVFTSGTATFASDNLIKNIVLKNQPYTTTPTSATEMNAVIVANFKLAAEDVSVSFPHPGTWFDFYSYGDEVAVTGSSLEVNIPAGGYKIYTDVLIEPSFITAVTTESNRSFSLFPNPVSEILSIDFQKPVDKIKIISAQGAVSTLVSLGENSFDLSNLSSGLYIVRFENSGRIYSGKIIRK
jgi:1,4-alpha-glucan branching enzyme